MPSHTTFFLKEYLWMLKSMLGFLFNINRFFSQQENMNWERGGPPLWKWREFWDVYHESSSVGPFSFDREKLLTFFMTIQGINRRLCFPGLKRWKHFWWLRKDFFMLATQYKYTRDGIRSLFIIITNKYVQIFFKKSQTVLEIMKFSSKRFGKICRKFHNDIN